MHIHPYEPLGLLLIVGAAYAAADKTPPAQSAPAVHAARYRTPSHPGQFWIWPTLAEARRWEAGHRERLCVREVPDGFATERC